jgi:hypothetical protein
MSIFDSLARLNRPDPKLSDFTDRQLNIMIMALQEFRNNNPGALYKDMDNILEIDVQLHSAYQKVVEINRSIQN